MAPQDAVAPTPASQNAALFSGKNEELRGWIQSWGNAAASQSLERRHRHQARTWLYRLQAGIAFVCCTLLLAALRVSCGGLEAVTHWACPFLTATTPRLSWLMDAGNCILSVCRGVTFSRSISGTRQSPLPILPLPAGKEKAMGMGCDGSPWPALLTERSGKSEGRHTHTQAPCCLGE